MEHTYVGRQFESVTTGTLDADNDWTVTVKSTERVTKDGTNWEEESIEFKAIDNSFQKAHKVALTAFVRWMDDNIYSKGTDSLVEAVKMQKELTTNEGNETEDNETPAA